MHPNDRRRSINEQDRCLLLLGHDESDTASAFVIIIDKWWPAVALAGWPLEGLGCGEGEGCRWPAAAA